MDNFPLLGPVLLIYFGGLVWNCWMDNKKWHLMKKNLCHSSRKILFWKMLQKGGTANCHYDGGGVVVYINI